MIELEKFVSGKTVQSSLGYKYFIPAHVNDIWKWNDSDLNRLLEQSAIKLGELNSFLKLVPNIDLFIQLHVTKEAVDSSRIEGTQTRIDEALLSEEEVAPDRRNDWKEVNNYIKALNFAINELETLPISSRLIRKTHEIILDSVRGEHKQPGQYRNSQNWIGGSSPSDAVFVPPAHHYVNELMDDLEKFIHNDEINLPELIKIAIAHYQFETIHPFLDGNGRIGRLLITLFLVDKKILSKPLLYLSSHFEKNKHVYYDKLTYVRTKNDMKQWIKYFLNGIAKTSDDAIITLSNVLVLKREKEVLINNRFGRKGNNAIKLLDYLFKYPIINAKKAQEITGLSYKAANDLIRDFVNTRIIKQVAGQSRNRMFVFNEYVDLFGNK